MAKAIETLSIQLKFKDAGSQAVIEKLRGSLKRLEMGAAGAKPKILGLRREILSQGRASVKSVANINAQITALKALRDEAKIGGNAFKKLTNDINKLNSEMGKSPSSGGGRNMGARRVTQTAGAIISGGIFGGPEGAIGGALGAFGGVEGAFAGAAIGAQVGMLRQAIGEMAEYAASISKLKIALRGVSGSQEDYNSALEASSQVTSAFNVPQQESVRGITRLAAAVTGAGGPMQDAETTFKNVTAAIKATGGTTQDVQGAITAMVQVFSKGKVSAEELSGQLGERLPGAVTMFAKANKMTLPELQKNLKAGTVGLNELMSFIELLGVKYTGTAAKIAASNAEAGARLTVAFDEMKAQVGAALLDTGAQFQDTFGKFIIEITPSMVQAAKVIAAGMSTLAQNLRPILAGLATFVSIIAGAALISAVTNLAAGLGLFGLAAKGAATGIGALTASMAINPLFAGALAVAGIVAGIVAITDALGKQKRELQAIAKLRPNQTYGSLSNEERQQKISATTSLKASAQAELSDIKRNKLYKGQTEETAPIKIAIRMKELRTEISGFDKELERLTNPVKRKEEKTLYTPPTTDGGGAGKNELANRIQQAQRLEAQTVKQLRLSEAQNSIQRLNAKHANERVALEDKLNKLVGDGNVEEINKTAERARANLELKIENELKKEGQKMGEMLADAAEKEANEKKKLNDQLQQSLADRKLELGLITQEEFNQLEIARERERLKGMEGITPEQIEEQMDMFKKVLNQTPLDKFIKSGKDSLKDLHTVAVNISQGIGNAVGNAMTSGIMGLIEGTKTAKEVFADFLKSVGQILAQEGAKMIATYIAIGIAKAFAGLLGGGGGGASAGDAAAMGASPAQAAAMSSSTGVAWSTDMPLSGGIIGGGFNSPGMANGGPVEAGRPYMVGERGPEMFIPGSNGGIMRNEDMRRMMGNSPAGAGAPQMNFTFETTNIGGTEFVSREQLEQAMTATRRQATNDGAKRGMSMTLDKMQNSPRTRSRVGIS